MLADYTGAFLTDQGEVRKILITRNGARGRRMRCCGILAAEAERVKKFIEARSAAMLVEASCALSRLGGALMDAYAERKTDAGRTRL